MIITVLSTQTKKFIGKYNSDYISYRAPFEDRTVLMHHEVAEGNFAEGYYLDESNNILYDFSYTPPRNPYQVTKFAELEDQKEQIDECIMRFAAENSELLMQKIVADSIVDIPSFVKLHLDVLISEMSPLMAELRSHYYWNIGEKMDAIIRDDLLRTDERLNSWRDKILEKVT